MSIEFSSLNDFANMNYRCSCGKIHKMDIDSIVIEHGILEHICEYIKRYDSKQIFLIADNNTYEIAGNRVMNLLENSGYSAKAHVFHRDGQLIPNEKALADLLLSIPPHTDLIIAVGSGTINDLSRYLAYKFGIPYIMVATAPSMDGFVSTVSPLIVNGLKITYNAKGPRAIIADLDIVCNAPKEMIFAGLGDILGKYTSLCDWKLSSIINNEYYCPEIVDLMKSAIEKCTDDLEGLKQNKSSAVKSLIEGLILSGIAMSFSENSRPASGAEHHLAHFWEMSFLFAGKEPVLHGTKVGITTIAILKLYELVKSIHPDKEKALQFVSCFDKNAFEQKLKEIYKSAASDIIAENNKEDRLSPVLHRKRLDAIVEHWPEIVKTIENLVPTAQYANEILGGLGAVTRPIQVGVDRETVLNSLKYGKELRTRYTVLQMLWDLGELDNVAQAVTDYMTSDALDLICSKPDEVVKKLENIKCFILDMDGTFYLDNRLLDGSIDFVNRVIEKGKKYYFYTNNSSKNAEFYEQKLRGIGCPEHFEKVLISNEVLISYLKENTSHSKVFVLGTEYLKKDFSKAGFILDEQNPDAVIIGFDTSLSYDRLTVACNLIKEGVPAYGVNPDFVCPLDNGRFLPDCGSISRLINASTGKQYEFFGKPSRYTFDYILRYTGYKEEEIAFVGDRLYTDIAVANGTKATTVLVLTGETTPELYLTGNQKADLVLRGLKELTDYVS